MNCKVLNILILFFSFLAIVYCATDSENETDDDNADNKIDETEGKAGEESDFPPNHGDYPTDNEDIQRPYNADEKKEKDCWATLNAKHLFNTMDPLDERFASARKEFQKNVGTEEFNQKMLDAMLQSRAAAERAIHNMGGNPSMIPAGLNLGGYCMMKQDDSILFFHRVKLRNDTVFRVNYLHNDLENMRLITRLSLNDLHLIGTYERAITDHDPSNLIYRPTLGRMELLLKNVLFKTEARYRLLVDRLVIELMISEIHVTQILMTYHNNGTASEPESVDRRTIDGFLERLKTDLNSWLQEYFNDYLMYFGLGGAKASAEIQKYDKEKGFALNEYVDEALELMKRRLCSLKAVAVKLPKFSIYAVNGLELKLTEGVLRGLDSMHRRSMATGQKKGKVRTVDANIAFSTLKVTYKYEALLNVGVPPLSGHFILSADELIAHLGMSLVQAPETVDLSISNLKLFKPQSLIVEGPVNRMIANFKHLLENHITSLMYNTMIYHVTMLSTLTKCEPSLISHQDPGEINCDGRDGNSDRGSGGEDYVVVRKDSIELELPADENNKPKKMILKYNEKFSLNEAKH